MSPTQSCPSLEPCYTTHPLLHITHAALARLDNIPFLKLREHIILYQSSTCNIVGFMLYIYAENFNLSRVSFVYYIWLCLHSLLYLFLLLYSYYGYIYLPLPSFQYFIEVKLLSF